MNNVWLNFFLNVCSSEKYHLLKEISMNGLTGLVNCEDL